jgi:hypothetical protein
MSDGTSYLTSTQLGKRYNRTGRTLARWILRPPQGFPHPVKINGRNLWLSHQIEAWERSLATEAASRPKAA